MDWKDAHMDLQAQAILDFWFGSDAGPGTVQKFWFNGGDDFDRQLRDRFAGDHGKAVAGEYAGWSTDPRGCLALVIVFDQFSRNIHRGSAAAFAQDPIARELAAKILSHGWDSDMLPTEQLFAYLPFEHSEDLDDQKRSVALFSAMKDHDQKAGWIDFAERHLVIVERFGRFPHRNAVLGRESTPEEIAFLQQPNSGF